MDIEQVNTAKLIPYARNQRTHSPDQVKKIAASIKEFGFINPVIIDNNNEIVAGHGRVEAASILGIESVPCLRASHLNQAQIKAYRIADNRLQDLSEFDEELLKLELEELRDELNYNIELVGFNLDFLDNIDDFEDSFDEIKEADTSASDTMLVIGEFRMSIPRDKYLRWLDNLRLETFNTKEQEQIILKRLKL